LTVREAAAVLSTGVDWVRDHLPEFPNAWRLPAGAAQTATGARNVGEIRIPRPDIEALAARYKLNREASV
jgi:hypothetical protein